MVRGVSLVRGVSAYSTGHTSLSTTRALGARFVAYQGGVCARACARACVGACIASLRRYNRARVLRSAEGSTLLADNAEIILEPLQVTLPT